MVPSWTETLIECGASVVGRTRFCIHPIGSVRDIPIVGGTKDIDWSKVAALKPDLIVLDREENPKSMAEASPYPVFDSHVTSVAGMRRELRALARSMNDDHDHKSVVQTRLTYLASRWEKIDSIQQTLPLSMRFPGLIEWVKVPSPTGGDLDMNARLNKLNVVYLIWKAPWMAASRDTFIGSVLTKIGFINVVTSHPDSATTAGTRYPVVELDQFDSNTIFLCSSEPYPFAKKTKSLRREFSFRKDACAIVNGESYSWFGVRSLQFLETALGLI